MNPASDRALIERAESSAYELDKIDRRRLGALARAGLEARPREPTKEMYAAMEAHSIYNTKGGKDRGRLKIIWQAAHDAYSPPAQGDYTGCADHGIINCDMCRGEDQRSAAQGTNMEDDLPGMLAVSKGVAEQKWPHTMDAKVWAEEFCKRWPTFDSEYMIGWFANAIMAGYDTANQRSAADGNPATDGKEGSSVSRPPAVAAPHHLYSGFLHDYDQRSAASTPTPESGPSQEGASGPAAGWRGAREIEDGESK